MTATRISVVLLLLIVFRPPPSSAQTPTFSRIDTASSLSLLGEVTVGDFDRDGFPDLVLNTRSLAEPLGLHFLRGLGDGTFAAPVQVFSGCCATVGAGDVNGDHALDLVFRAGIDLLVLPGHGDGTFGPLIRSAGGPSAARPPLIVDFNRDGRLDVAWASQAGGVSVLLGNGDGTFGTASIFPISGGAVPNGLAGGDFNGDGIPDIAASNPGPPNFTGTNVSVLLGRGDGTFSPATDFTVGISPFPIVTADFNADQQLDVAVANYQSWSVSVLLGHGDGTFGANLEVLDGPFPVGLGAADFNGDGHPDLAVGSGATSVAVLLGHGDGTLAPAIEVPGLSSAYNLVVDDFNQDGKPDVLVVYIPVAGAFSVFLNTTSADVTPPVVTVSADPAILWPPNGRMIPVTLTGTITDTGSGVDSSRATFEIQDEYGLVQPSGAIELNADGSYSIRVLLPASRKGSDADGRTFSITVDATDKAGNRGTATTLVRVPHDRG